MAEAALSLGSNQGDKEGAIETALRLIDEQPDVNILKRSRLYRTAPWGDTDQDWFVNACVLVRTDLPPRALLDLCLSTEARLGRDRTQSRRWGPRPIDIDVLFYDDIAMDGPGLVLPHPHLFERAFVLVPLAEIAPDRMLAGKRIADAADALDTSGVVPL